jgi:hypothetical protein
MTQLRQRMIECLQLRGLSERTQESYVQAVRQLAEHYHKSRDLQRFSDGCARALSGRLSAAITVCQREAPARLCLRGRRRTNWVARN